MPTVATYAVARWRKSAVVGPVSVGRTSAQAKREKSSMATCRYFDPTPRARTTVAVNAMPHASNAPELLHIQGHEFARIGALVAADQAPEVLEPREEALDFPAATVAPELAPALFVVAAVAGAGRGELNSAGRQPGVELVTFIALVADRAGDLAPDETGFEGRDEERGLGGVRTGDSNGARTTSTVGDCRDSGALPFAAEADGRAPLFRAREGRINEGLGEVVSPGGGEFARQGVQHPRERTAPGPALKATMTRLIGRVPIGQVLPRRAGAHHPEDAVEDVARIAPRAPPTIGTPARLRHYRGEARPLGIFRSATRQREKNLRTSPLRRLTSPGNCHL
jgi:hypothetical protein